MPGMAIAGEMFDTGHQIQRTSPGGFYDWHHDGCDTRQLTFIFYLNDVKAVGVVLSFVMAQGLSEGWEVAYFSSHLAVPASWSSPKKRP